MIKKLTIYDAMIDDFLQDVRTNKITQIMRNNFRDYFGRNVPDSEFNSWQNSMNFVKNLVELSDLKDNKIVLEYEIPYNTGRIDCLLYGKNKDKSNVVLIELKQWQFVKPLYDEDYFVETYTGGAYRKVSHPSKQVEGYFDHLNNFIEVFDIDPNYKLNGYSYCHNYVKEENIGLFDNEYLDVLNKFPVYTKDDVLELANKLRELLYEGSGLEVFNRFMQSPVKPAKKLLESTADIINHKPVFSLLAEQILAKDLIISKLRKSFNNEKKSVIIVKGGPGTGKSVIALHTIAYAALKTKNVRYSCKSKPFTEAIQKSIGTKSRVLFESLNRFVPSKCTQNELDLLVIDEAHRISKSSNNQYTPKEHRTDMPQMEQLIRCSKNTVFFIDDKQIIRSQEIGNSEIIKEYAKKWKCDIEEIELNSQFRCSGSDGYLHWIESTLGYSQGNKILTNKDKFDFKIFDSPKKLYDFLYAKEMEKLNSARLVAGYCWPWSNPTSDGSLVNDVVIPEHNFFMPWEAKDGVKLKDGIPKWYQWAIKTQAINQVGCIYTVQGFEFDYIGVIIGNDLKYDKENDCLIGNISANKDPMLIKYDKDNFKTYVKNIYRVLMSRGMKGCYVYFMDKEVEKYFRDRINIKESYPVSYPEITFAVTENEIKYDKNN